MKDNMWLIDANALWNEFANRYCDIPTYDSIRLDEIKHGISLINNAIPVDAVPVVRCKDCKNRYSSEFCECRPEDAFCSDGERRQ